MPTTVRTQDYTGEHRIWCLRYQTPFQVGKFWSLILNIPSAFFHHLWLLKYWTGPQFSAGHKYHSCSHSNLGTVIQSLQSTTILQPSMLHDFTNSSCQKKNEQYIEYIQKYALNLSCQKQIFLFVPHAISTVWLYYCLSVFRYLL